MQYLAKLKPPAVGVGGFFICNYTTIYFISRQMVWEFLLEKNFIL